MYYFHRGAGRRIVKSECRIVALFLLKLLVSGPTLKVGLGQVELTLSSDGNGRIEGLFVL